MSRLFDGVDDQMVYGSSPPQLTGALTMLIVVKIVVTADTTWLSFLENEGTSNAARPSIGRRNNGQIYYSTGAGPQSAITINDSDGWMVVAVTKAAGTVIPRMHKCVIGGGNTHTNAGGSIANDLASTVALRIGGNEDFANILVAAAAEWAGTVLSDADIDGIAAAATTQSIADLSPTWLVDDSDTFATNLVNPGTTDRTAITGTADSADDPAGWVYGLGGGGTAHEQPVDDTITGTDAQAKTAGKAIADTASVTDQNTRTTAFVRQINDTITGTDAITKAPVHPVADTGSLTDASTRRVGKTASDSITGTDSQAKTVTHPIVDTGTLTDQAATVWDAIRLIQDAGVLTDNVDTGGVTAHEIEIDDTIAGTDQLDREWDAIRAISDPITGTDAHSKQLGIQRADTVAGTDQFTRTWAATIALNETPTVTDALSREWDTSLALADTATVTDLLEVTTPTLRWDLEPQDRWPPDSATRWNVDPQTRW